MYSMLAPSAKQLPTPLWNSIRLISGEIDLYRKITYSSAIQIKWLTSCSLAYVATCKLAMHINKLHIVATVNCDLQGLAYIVI